MRLQKQSLRTGSDSGKRQRRDELSGTTAGAALSLTRALYAVRGIEHNGGLAGGS